MSALLVFLPPRPINTSTEFKYVVTRDGSSVRRHGRARAAVLPMSRRAGAEVVAVVPAAMLSWHRVELPKGTAIGSPRLRAVLEGLLEDRLLDEPDTVHFALQPQVKPGASLWVAACDRAWLRAAVQVLEGAQRPAARIVPEFSPQETPALYAMGDPRQPSLVLTNADGVMVLPLSAQALTLLPSLPEDTRCVAEAAVAGLAEQVLNHAPALQQAPERWLQAAQSKWDLAQFDFANTGRTRAIKKFGTAWADLLAAPQWRPARWGALALVIINLVGVNAWAWRERAALDQKRDAIRRTLTESFPQVKVVVDAPVQMEREVAALRVASGTTSGRDLEAMLAALSISAPAAQPVSAIEFAQGELRIKGLAYTPEQAQALAGALKSQGYSSVLQGDTLNITPETQP